MGDVARAGRTVVLVSHQLNQIRRLSHRVVWVDAGQIRQSGPTAGVVSAYEAAMSTGDRPSPSSANGTAQKARFVRWDVRAVEGEPSHGLNTLDPVIVRFVLQVHAPIRRGVHGVTLYNSERQIIWGRAAYELDLAVGVHELTYKFPMLPLRPGGYTWSVSLWDDNGLVDLTDFVPEMIVFTENYQHPRDEWNGVLNLPSEFSVEEKRGEHG